MIWAAMSDIFAAVADSHARGGAVDDKVWKIGEQCWTPNQSGDAMRYMAKRAGSTTVEIVPPREVGVVQASIVVLLVTGHASQWRPHALREPERAECQERMQPGCSAVAIWKGVHPKQPVVRTRDTNNPQLNARKLCVTRGPSFNQVGDLPRRRREMATGGDIGAAPCSGRHALGSRVSGALRRG